MNDLANRRPLKSRETSWAAAAAKSLAGAGVSANGISFAGVIFAIAGCGLFLWSADQTGGARIAALLLAATTIQLRLLCNLLDGMVAVEHGKGSATGPIWNELPDRIADSLFLVGAGYAAAASFPCAATLGWLCAVLAVLTAYVRELGRGLGQPADFSGPMAKPHRMAALTLACVVSAAEPLWGWDGQTLVAALGIIAIGAAFTAARRTVRLGRALKG